MTIVAIFLAFALLATSVTAQDYEPCREDFDGNYVIGVEDQVTLTDCLTGPGVYNLDINCVPADFDRDHHIDLRDLAKLAPKSGPCHACAMKWSREFAFPGTDGTVNTLTNWFDGTELALYAGGSFTRAGGIVVNNIAKWNGSEWSSVGGGVNGPVHALALYDDGSGPALFVGGAFSTAGGVTAHNIAKWDGKAWTTLGSGAGSAVHALAVHNDGTGPALFAASDSSWQSEGINALGIAKWNGTSWLPLGGDGSGIAYNPSPTTPGGIRAMATYDDGSGPALFVGGDFCCAYAPGSQTEVFVNNIAKWDGKGWSSLERGLERLDISSPVASMTVFDPGDGATLVVGGAFEVAESSVANYVAGWNGTTWFPLGGGLQFPGHFITVHAMEVTGDALGRSLLVSGGVLEGSELEFFLARWNGRKWSMITTKLDGSILAMRVAEFGPELKLFVGGAFSLAGTRPDAQHVAAFDGQDWSTLGSGLGIPVGGLGTMMDGDRENLVAGRDFGSGFRETRSPVVKWDGENWMELGGGLLDNYTPFGNGNPDVVRGFASVETSGEWTLYTAGHYHFFEPDFFAQWNADGWSWVGPEFNPEIQALAYLDDGRGEALFVGGEFNGARTGFNQFVFARGIARVLNGEVSALGDGLNGTVHDIIYYDDGSGPGLVAVGEFTHSGDLEVRNVARWNSESWTGLGPGVSGRLYAAAVYDDGTGPALYVGGTICGMAKWDGLSWSTVGCGLDGTLLDLAVFDDGTGPALYAGGNFGFTGHPYGANITKWDGRNWSPLSIGLHGDGIVDGIVRSLLVFSDDSGPALYAGGSFFGAGHPSLFGTVSTSHIAKWYRPITCEGPGGVLNAE